MNEVFVKVKCDVIRPLPTHCGRVNVNWSELPTLRSYTFERPTNLKAKFYFYFWTTVLIQYMEYFNNFLLIKSKIIILIDGFYCRVFNFVKYIASKMHNLQRNCLQKILDKLVTFEHSNKTSTTERYVNLPSSKSW